MTDIFVKAARGVLLLMVLLGFGAFAYRCQGGYDDTVHRVSGHWVSFPAFLAVLLLSGWTWDVLKRICAMPREYFTVFAGKTALAIVWFALYVVVPIGLDVLARESLTGRRVVWAASGLAFPVLLGVLWRAFFEWDEAWKAWKAAPNNVG